MDSNNLPMKQETGLIHKVKMFFYKMLKKDRMEKEPVHINASVPDADSSLIKQLSEILSGGLTFVSYSDSSHLYNFSGQVYLPVGQKGEAWD